MSEGNVTKTVTALSAVGQIFSFLQKTFFAFFFMALEFAKMKQKKAENKTKSLETDIKIREQNDKIDKTFDGKDSADIINDYLQGDSGSGGE